MLRVEIHHIKTKDGDLRRTSWKDIKAERCSGSRKVLGTMNENLQQKALKKGGCCGKDKPLTILMIQPWERVAKPRITQSFSPETAMSFPPLSEEDGTESPMIIEANDADTLCIGYMLTAEHPQRSYMNIAS
ncbi:hypothetical protein Tco_1136328 [Tanacetum coccineum]